MNIINDQILYFYAVLKRGSLQEEVRWSIKDGVSHISFKDYIGLGHNYQHTKSAVSVNKSKDYLGTVMQDWLRWLEEN